MHVARAQVHTALPQATETPFTAFLCDKAGARLAEGAVMRLETAPSGCGCGKHGKDPTTYLAQAFIPDVAPGGRLEIAEGDELVWQREAPGEPPSVKLTEVTVGKRGTATVAWESSAGVDEFWLRWSRDGKEWQSVLTGMTRRRAQIPAGQLPTGQGRLQVVAHDGFYSTYSEPRNVRVPDRPAEAVILHPMEGHTYQAGQTIRLWGSVAEAGGDDAVWLVDGKEVARGLDAFVSFEPGKHTVTLRLGPRGRPAKVTVTVKR